MWSHSLSISITKMKKLLSSFIFALSFLFFSFFFSKSSTYHRHDITIIMIFTVASPLGIMLPISWSLKWTRLALRVSSIHKTKLELSNMLWRTMSQKIPSRTYDLIKMPLLGLVTESDSVSVRPVWFSECESDVAVCVSLWVWVWLSESESECESHSELWLSL